MSSIPFGATQGTSYTSSINNVKEEERRAATGSRTPPPRYDEFCVGHSESEREYRYLVLLRGRECERKSEIVFGNTDLHRSLVRSKQLGEGAQGLVSLCTSPEGRRLVIKDLEFERPEDAQACFKQSMRFTSLKHVHLISYLAGERGSQYDVTGSKQTHYVSILMPYYPDGDVQKLVQHGSRLSWLAISSLGLQIATALEYLHKLPTPVVHGDIKPDNVLLYSNKEQCVLMDLDTATECALNNLGEGDKKTPHEGTVEWMAPEVAAGKPITTASDIWSLGLVLFAMVARPEFMMFENPRTRQQCLLNAPDWPNGYIKELITSGLDEAKCPKILREAIVMMVDPNVETRHTAVNVVAKLTYATENILLGLV